MNKSYEVVKPIKNQLAYDGDKFLDYVEIAIQHCLGGMNYFDYSQNKRGWYMHFSPVHIEKHDSYNTRSTVLFHDKSYKIYCHEGNRFSEKMLSKLATVLDDNLDKIVELYDEDKKQELFNFIQQTFQGIK